MFAVRLYRVMHQILYNCPPTKIPYDASSSRSFPQSDIKRHLITQLLVGCQVLRGVVRDPAVDETGLVRPLGSLLSLPGPEHPTFAVRLV